MRASHIALSASLNPRCNAWKSAGSVHGQLAHTWLLRAGLRGLETGSAVSLQVLRGASPGLQPLYQDRAGLV